MEVEVPVEVVKKVQRRVEIPVEKLVCNNIKTVQKKVDIDRCVWKEVPVEKVVEIKVAAALPSPSSFSILTDQPPHLYASPPHPQTWGRPADLSTNQTV